MAYTDQKMSGGKVAAIVIVVLIHAALGYAFVTGLAYQYIKKTSEKLNTFDVEPPPPPPTPDEPPPPPPDTPNLPPPPTTVVTPPPIVPPQAPTFQMQTTPVIPQFQPTSPPAPPAPSAPPAPPAPRISQAAGLKGNPGQFFGRDAYPPDAVRAEAQGRVRATLTVGVDGRVSNCVVSSSSGNRSLDDATCRISRSRVRFSPAKDQNGAPITSTYPLSVVWNLEE